MARRNSIGNLAPRLGGGSVRKPGGNTTKPGDSGMPRATPKPTPNGGRTGLAPRLGNGGR